MFLLNFNSQIFQIMKRIIITLAFTTLAALQSCQKKQQSESAISSAKPNPNTLTEEEKADGWELLFDGSTLNGWKRYNTDTIGPLWIVKDGMIVCNGEGLTEGTKGVGGS